MVWWVSCTWVVTKYTWELTNPLQAHVPKISVFLMQLFLYYFSFLSDIFSFHETTFRPSLVSLIKIPKLKSLRQYVMVTRLKTDTYVTVNNSEMAIDFNIQNLADQSSRQTLIVLIKLLCNVKRNSFLK